VRPLLVVVADVATQQPQQMAPATHQRPVQTLRPHGPDPALGRGIRLRRPDRGSERLPSLATEHLVEGASELGVVVAEQNPCRQVLIVQVHRGIPCLLARPCRIRVGCDLGRTTRLMLSWMKNSTNNVLSRIVSTVKKSHATIPSACTRRNCAQLGPHRRGAEPRPCRRSSVLIVVAPTRIPSLRSSPQILTQPHRAFSLAIRTMSSAICGSIDGLPGVRSLP
jgi:hypothetical protein